MAEGHYCGRWITLPRQIQVEALRNLLQVPGDHDLFIADSTMEDSVCASGGSMEFLGGLFWFYSAPRKINQG